MSPLDMLIFFFFILVTIKAATSCIDYWKDVDDEIREASEFNKNLATIARVRNPDYGKEIPYLRSKLSLEMIINPEYEAAVEAARILYLPAALSINSFAHGSAEIVKIKIPEGNVLPCTA